MIALICGKIAYKGISSIVVDANGVGYRIFIPLTTFYELPEAGEPVTLHVNTHVYLVSIQCRNVICFN